LVTDEGKIRSGIDILVQVSAAAREMQKSVRGTDALATITRELFGTQQAARGSALFEQLGGIAGEIDSVSGSASGMARAFNIAYSDGSAAIKEYNRQLEVTLNDPWVKLEKTVQRLRNM